MEEGLEDVAEGEPDQGDTEDRQQSVQDDDANGS
jgi:hypothetical protein